MARDVEVDYINHQCPIHPYWHAMYMQQSTVHVIFISVNVCPLLAYSCNNVTCSVTVTVYSLSECIVLWLCKLSFLWRTYNIMYVWWSLPWQSCGS